MNFDAYPSEWRPVLDALLEVLDEYAPGGFALLGARRVDGRVEISLSVPWLSDVISASHRMAERALTRIDQAVQS